MSLVTELLTFFGSYPFAFFLFQHRAEDLGCIQASRLLGLP